MISMEKRIFLFDNLKFFLILTVVIGHFIDYITKSSHMMSGLFLFIYSFHMPFFIYLAGLFHSNHNIKNRCVSFIAIGFSMKILFALCRMIFFSQSIFLFVVRFRTSLVYVRYGHVYSNFLLPA